MLKVQVYVNFREIDELGIVNTGYKVGDDHLYRICHPKYNHLEILHNREEKWSVLVEKVLHAMNEEDKKLKREEHIPTKYVHGE
jgi:hypothetical protein